MKFSKSLILIFFICPVAWLASCCQALPDAHTCSERYEKLKLEFYGDVDALTDYVEMELDGICTRSNERECVRSDQKVKSGVAQLVTKVKEAGKMRGCSLELDLNEEIAEELRDALELIGSHSFPARHNNGQIEELHLFIRDELEMAWTKALMALDES